MLSFFRPAWQRLFPSRIIFGVMMILLLGIPRFIFALNANITGNYNLISVIFVFMWIAPFIFLTKQGRRDIGISKPSDSVWLPMSFFIGLIVCAIMFFTAQILFGDTTGNWFKYISNSYKVSAGTLSEKDLMTFFIIYAIIGMTFSPIGEELFYRGIVHESFKQWGDNKASIADSLAFAITHLAHFGIVYESGRWMFLPVPALMWVAFMFLASHLFYLCRKKTGSIAGAIICHAGFNLAMMYFIFFHILV